MDPGSHGGDHVSIALRPMATNRPTPACYRRQMAADRLVPCPDCRAPVPDIDGPTHPYLGANAGCWATWGAFRAGAMARPGLGALMPLAVDAYMAQHPGTQGRRQAQSVAVHLASICLVLELGRTPVEGIRAKQVLLVRNPLFGWLQPPGDLGAVTILDVLAVPEATVPEATVLDWATVVWRAWSVHHAAIRPLAEQALRGIYR